MARGHRSAVRHFWRPHAQREMDVQQSARRLTVPAVGLRQLHVALGLGDRRGLRQLHMHSLERVRVGKRDDFSTHSGQVYVIIILKFSKKQTKMT